MCERVTINVVALPTHNNEARQVFKNNQQTILTESLPPTTMAKSCRCEAFSGRPARTPVTF